MAEAVKTGADTRSDDHVFQMVENMPLNVMMTDLDFNITYANKASLATLRTLQEYLPVAVDNLIGSSIDIFHKRPMHQRRLLSDPSNLPHTAKIQLGPEVLRLDVAAIFSGGEYVGPMVSWAVITEQVETERQKQALQEAQEVARRDLADKVGQLLDVVNAAADGDLTHPIHVSGDDAIGQMGEGLQAFLSELRGSVEGIRTTSAQLASASEELTATARVLGESVGQTAQEVQSLSDATEEVDGNVQAVASAAEEMSASITEIARNASQASQVAQDAVNMATETDQTVSSLGVSSKEISEVLRVITSIAQQTNLLALNATIEAARAGEAGKGFAVVAGEVKELAKETARATQDIRQRIDAIQADADRSVDAIRDIGGIIRRIAEIQDNIASAVEEQSAVTHEISRNASTAAQSTAEMRTSTARVAEAAGQARQAVSEASDATDELATMATDLDGQVQRFRT